MIPFYIGTYTVNSSQNGVASKGIHRCLFDPATGQMSQLELAAEIDNPSFLTIHPHQPILYSCSEVRRDGKREGSQVVAFRIQPNGQLMRLGSQASGGLGPCHVSTDRDGRVLLVANYAGGSISSYPIAVDGSIGPIASHVQHSGRSVHPDRQEAAHAHCIVPDPSNQYACAVDLGMDQVVVYKMDPSSGKLTALPNNTLHVRPGAGPRHLTFHPDGQHAFLIHELGNTLSALRWDADAGRFTELATVATLPHDFNGESTTAEILVHPNGRFVYGSNRGHDSVAIFEFQTATNDLIGLGHVTTHGRTPRNFCIDPTGRYLLVENQDSHSIFAFEVNSADGSLKVTGQPITVGSPCCIKFFNRENR